MKRKLISFVSELLITALLLGGIYGANYLLPQKGIMARTMTVQAAGGATSLTSGSEGSQTENSTDTGMESLSDNQTSDNQAREKELQALVDNYSNGLLTTTVSLDSQNWRQKFADKFTDQVISTDTSYTSPDISVQISHNSYDTNKLDKTQGGNHEKYGTNISYVLADIYVSGC